MPRLQHQADRTGGRLMFRFIAGLLTGMVMFYIVAGAGYRGR